MAKYNLTVYMQDEDSLSLVGEVCQQLSVSDTSFLGGKDIVVEDAKSWIIPPQLLMVDLSGETDYFACLEEIATSGMEADIEVIVVGDNDDVRLARKLKSFGVRDYILKPLEREEVVDALRGAMFEGDSRGEAVNPAKLITVTSVDGGNGTSMIASAVASHYASEGFRTLIVDLDISSGVQNILNNGQQTSGFLESLQDVSRVDSIALSRMVEASPSNKGIYFLSETGRLRDTPNAASLTAFLGQCTSSFDYVIVDLPSHCDWGLPTLSLSATVLLTVKPNVLSLNHYKRFIDKNSRSLITDSLRVLVNDVNKSKSEGVGVETFRKVYKDAKYIALPHDPQTMYRQLYEAEVFLASGIFSKQFKLVRETLPKPDEEIILKREMLKKKQLEMEKKAKKKTKKFFGLF